MSAPTFSQQPAQTPTPAAGYFVDQKKGEVNELKQLLKNINVERDVKRKREIIKKVIAYMTLGIDVSRLFTDMCMAIETKDLVIKKMVYLYLCNYAHKQPDMALMCINTLRRDCDNEDPMVRGLALRSLCNLRLDSILEYVAQPLDKSLSDLSAYVRKTGVMGVLKLTQLKGFADMKANYIPKLYDMLLDVDANVVTNVILVLNELQIEQGGMQLTSSTIMTLLTRIGEFTEWGLNAILELVARYRPASEDETFAIMNLLDPVLRTANSGAVLSTFKCFMNLTAKVPELHTQIYLRAKPPILTLITSSNFEVQYNVLKHLEIILRRKNAKGIFDDEFRQFFVRYNEPAHVKCLKVELLPIISNDVNAADIAAELGEYVTDVDSELSKRAIDALGKIAMSVAAVSPTITQTLIDLVDLDIPYVRAQAVLNVSYVMRVVPSIRSQMLPYLSKCLKRVDDAEAKGALLWMLGEYGHEVTEAPYLLEPIIDAYGEEQSSHIKLHVLAASMKLFFKRPPEMQAMLGRLLVSAVNDSSDQDVHDRALMYYRLLQHSQQNLKVAASLFHGQADASIQQEGRASFAEDEDDTLRNAVFQEFNSLAVLFGAPSSQFIAEEFQMKIENAPIVDDAFEVPGTGFVGASLESAQTAAPESMPQPIVQDTPTVAAPMGGSINLLDLGDDFDVNYSAPSSSNAYGLENLEAPTLQLDRSPPEMTAQNFQSLWSSLPEAYNGQLCMLSRAVSASTEVEALMSGKHVLTMASGALPGGAGFKFFFYAFEMSDGNFLSATESRGTYLVQCVVMASGEVSAVIKVGGESKFGSAACAHFSEVMVSAMAPLGATP